MRVTNLIRYILPIYTLALEILYPFTFLPISPEIKQHLTTEAHALAYFLALFSSLRIWTFIYCSTILSFSRAVLALILRSKPGIRQKLNERRRVKAELELQQTRDLQQEGHDLSLKQKQKYLRALRLFGLNMLLSYTLVGSDAIFNREIKEDVSFIDGVCGRYLYINNRTFFIIFTTLILLLAAYVLIRISRAVKSLCIRIGGRYHAIALDEEHVELVEGSGSVQEQGVMSGLDGKLIDFADGIETFTEKMERVVVYELQEQSIWL